MFCSVLYLLHLQVFANWVLSVLQKTLTLVAGTSAGQVILLLATPVLSRIYSPSDFGQFAMLLALVAIVSPFSTLRYETAILIKEKSHPPKSLLILSSAILFAVTFLILLISSPINSILPELSERRSLSTLFALFVFINGLNLILVSWHSRFERFSVISAGRLLQAIGIVIGQITMAGAFGPLGLAYGYLIGLGLNGAQLMGVLISRDRGEVFQKVSLDKVFVAARKHSRFPLWLTWSSLLNGMVNQLPNLLFGKLFSASVAGNYMMATRVLRSPLSLIGQSIYQVLAQYVGANVDKRTEVVQVLRKLMLNMANLSIVPFIGLALLLPSVVEIVLGAQWSESGIYALIILPWLFTIFISWPLTGVFNAFGFQRKLLMFNILFFIVIALAFLGAVFGVGVYGVLVFLSAAGSVTRVYYSVWIIGRLDRQLSLQMGRLVGVYTVIISVAAAVGLVREIPIGLGQVYIG